MDSNKYILILRGLADKIEQLIKEETKNGECEKYRR